MARQRSKPKFGIATLLILLALAIYYNYSTKNEPKSRPAREYKAKKTRKHREPKEPKEIRHLTTFTGKVTGIKDGDTFEVLFEGQPERVRLAEIDCPEKSQAFGKNAKQYASDLCFGKTVTVTSNGKRDRYGRIVGTVVTQEGTNVNEALLKAGFAWHYKQYSKNAGLSVFEENARQSHLGLWADKDPVAPWDWRKQKRTHNIN